MCAVARAACTAKSSGALLLVMLDQLEGKMFVHANAKDVSETVNGFLQDFVGSCFSWFQVVLECHASVCFFLSGVCLLFVQRLLVHLLVAVAAAVVAAAVAAAAVAAAAVAAAAVAAAAVAAAAVAAAAVVAVVAVVVLLLGL